MLLKEDETMKFQTKGWAVLAAVALVGSMASTALAIEAFQERFEWGDMSKPTTIQGRVVVLDPYDEAVWLNVAVFGGNAESGLWWQKLHPGKNIKFYADKGAWEELKKLARPHAGPAAAKEVPPSSEGVLVEVVATEPEQNHRVISSVKKLPEVAGAPGKTKSITSLRHCGGKPDQDSGCENTQSKMAAAPKGGEKIGLHYDVLIPGGTPVGGLIPNSPPYNKN